MEFDIIRQQYYNCFMIIRRDVVNLTVPVIAEQAFVVLMGIVNTIMAGRLGEEAVAAIGMVDSANNIFIAFFSALAVGGTVVVAHYSGRDNFFSANEATRHTIYSGFLLSFLIMVILFIFRHDVLQLLFGAAEKTVMNNALIYLEITLPTYPLIAITSIACGVLRGAGDTRTPMKITITMNFLNVVFSYILIYGLDIGILSISSFGITGAAMGIAIARIIGAVLILMTLLKGSKLIKLTISRYFKPDLAMLKSIFSIGIPASVESLLFNGGKLITQIFIVGMGTASIAANSIAGSIFGLISIPASAFTIAATTLVGQHMGRGDREEARSILIYMAKAASISLLVMCAAMFPFSDILPGIYVKNNEVIKLTAILLKTSVAAMPLLWAVSFLVPAGFKGAGDAKYTMMVSVFSMWAFRITMGYVLGVPLRMGILGVWMGMYIDWAVRAVFFLIRLKSGKWQKKMVILNQGSEGEGLNV